MKFVLIVVIGIVAFVAGYVSGMFDEGKNYAYGYKWKWREEDVRNS